MAKPRGREKWPLTPERCDRVLCQLFDLWCGFVLVVLVAASDALMLGVLNQQLLAAVSQAAAR